MLFRSSFNEPECTPYTASHFECKPGKKQYNVKVFSSSDANGFPKPFCKTTTDPDNTVAYRGYIEGPIEYLDYGPDSIWCGLEQVEFCWPYRFHDKTPTVCIKRYTSYYHDQLH